MLEGTRPIPPTFDLSDLQPESKIPGRWSDDNQLRCRLLKLPQKVKRPRCWWLVGYQSLSGFVSAFRTFSVPVIHNKFMMRCNEYTTTHSQPRPLVSLEFFRKLFLKRTIPTWRHFCTRMKVIFSLWKVVLLLGEDRDFRSDRKEAITYYRL